MNCINCDDEQTYIVHDGSNYCFKCFSYKILCASCLKDMNPTSNAKLDGISICHQCVNAYKKIKSLLN